MSIISLKPVLITGVPGIGKTTVIRALAGLLDRLNPGGFYTAEIRERGTRTGFRLVGLDGRERVLAHVGIDSPYRVGRYGVDVGGFEDFLGGVPFWAGGTGLVVIDEIGKMECFSPLFREVVGRVLGSGKPLVATIALKGGGFIREIRERSGVELIQVTHGNRARLASHLAGKFDHLG